ncbi:MAG: peptidase M16, partial [Pseudomonadota bacterium]
MKSISMIYLLSSLSFWGCTKNSSSLKSNNNFAGYKLVKAESVETIGSEVVEMEHIKSGATVVLIKNKDQARSFMAGFRTPPYDDTGLFHIFEHAVLEGSRLYPSKSNFFHLANSSVASFINAMTGPVYTLYPFVSRSTKDFDNLLSVYMDAVFFPNVLED